MPDDPLKQWCKECGEAYPPHEVNEAGACEICASLLRLRDTLRAQRKIVTPPPEQQKFGGERPF